MAKNNIRSIRFSDELAELIDRQVGDTFTAKFESLVTRCVWELPAKEQQLAELEEQIRRKQQEMRRLQQRLYNLANSLQSMESLANQLNARLSRELENQEEL